MINCVRQKKKKAFNIYAIITGCVVAVAAIVTGAVPASCASTTHEQGVAQVAASSDGSLATSLRRAFVYSPGLQAAQAGRRAAVAAYDGSFSGYRPSVQLSGEMGMQQRAARSTRTYNEAHKLQPTGTVSMVLSQPLWTGGAITATVATRKAGLDNADNAMLDSANNLAYSVIYAHADVVRRETLVNISKEHIATHQSILRTVRQRYQQGVATSGEVSQIESRLARTRAQYAANMSALDAAIAEYIRVVGVQPPTSLAAVVRPLKLFTAVQAVIDSGLAHNPRILAYKAIIAMRSGERDLAESAHWPTISAEVGPQYQRQGGRAEPEQHSFEAGLRVKWDVYNGGADVAAVRERSAMVVQARKELESSIDSLKQDATSTWSAAKAAAERSKLFAEARRQSNHTRANFREQFIAGQRSLLDVLDAESDYFASSGEEVLAASDAILGDYRMLALSGELLDEVGFTPDMLRK